MPELTDTRFGENPRSGAELAADFHRDVVGPLLSPIRYAAARLGSGSDVLGYDDAMSRDHDWGCRLTVLVDESSAKLVPQLQEMLAARLPDEYAGHPVRFPTTWDRTVTHKVQVATVYGFAASRLGVRPGPEGLDALEWLTVSGQGVLEVIGGPVFHDETTELAPLQAALQWYSPDVDRFTIASLWAQIGQRMNMVGRTGMRGQDLQSRLLSASIADKLTHLAFLVHRQWMPYAKWREARLRTLPGADRLAELLAEAVTANPWQAREQAISDAAELLLDAQRARGLPAPERAIGVFYDRPFRTVDDSAVGMLLADVSDERLRSIPLIGGVDQWIDSDQVLSNPHLRASAATAYPAWLSPTPSC
jgi:hypothetical protein